MSKKTYVVTVEITVKAENDDAAWKSVREELGALRYAMDCKYMNTPLIDVEMGGIRDITEEYAEYEMFLLDDLTPVESFTNNFKE